MRRRMKNVYYVVPVERSSYVYLGKTRKVIDVP